MNTTALAALLTYGTIQLSVLCAQQAPTPTTALHLQPASGVVNVCPDTLLAIEFSQPPIAGNTGQIRIYDNSSNQVVDTIDLSLPPTSQNYIIGGANNFHLYPILPNGNTAVIYPHHHVLAYGKSYRVEMDSGVLLIDGQPFPATGEKLNWVFTTKTAPPPADARRIEVAADGSGDFATVQGAVDFAPDHPGQPLTIHIHPGLYSEIVYFDHKSMALIIFLCHQILSKQE
jgi:hypothetical protein